MVNIFLKTLTLTYFNDVPASSEIFLDGAVKATKSVKAEVVQIALLTIREKVCNCVASSLKTDVFTTCVDTYAHTLIRACIHIVIIDVPICLLKYLSKIDFKENLEQKVKTFCWNKSKQNQACEDLAMCLNLFFF